jgi:hypothetical protein
MKKIDVSETNIVNRETVNSIAGGGGAAGCCLLALRAAARRVRCFIITSTPCAASPNLLSMAFFLFSS